jgi:hypothetical protein
VSILNSLLLLEGGSMSGKLPLNESQDQWMEQRKPLFLLPVLRGDFPLGAELILLPGKNHPSAPFSRESVMDSKGIL